MDLIVEVIGAPSLAVTAGGQVVAQTTLAALETGPGVAPFAAGTRIRLSAGGREVTFAG